MEWDTCAAHAISKAAGASVLKMEKNEESQLYEPTTEVIYNKENLLSPYFICYGNIRDLSL